MSDYQKIIELAESEAVAYGISLPKDLHTKLVLGQTRYVCRYGSLGDGHEKITPSQRYYQAIKEIYYLCCNVKDQHVLAKEAQADILDAEEFVAVAKTPQEKLRSEAKLMRARSHLTSCLVIIQDQMRMIDEYDKIRRELEEQVTTQYPNGIEQAEQDNWAALFEYRMRRERVPGMAREQVSNIPLDPVTKAQLGYEYHRPDAIAPLELTNPNACRQLAHQYEKHLEQLKEIK